MQDRLGEAHNFYQKALSLDPNHPDFLANFAYLKAKTGDVAGAREMADRALQAQPGHQTAAQILAQLKGGF